MIELINQELLKLQNELGKFQDSIKAIKKTNEVSENLIESSKNLQASFKSHLEKIESLFSDYMNKTYRHSEEKINQIYKGFTERIAKEEEILSKLAELAEQNELLMSETLQKIGESHKKAVEDHTNKSLDLLNEQQDYLRLKAEEMKKEISSMVETHKKRLQKEEKIMNDYVDLAAATAELSKYIKSVNFPDKLSEINKQLDKIHETNKKSSETTLDLIRKTSKKAEDNNNEIIKIKQEVTKISQDKRPQQILDKVNKIASDNRIDIISKQVTKNSKKISSSRFWIIMIFVISFIFYTFFIMVFFKLFPHFIEDMF